MRAPCSLPSSAARARRSCTPRRRHICWLGVPPRLTRARAHPSVQLKELKQELSGLRVAKVTGGAPNKLSKM